MYKDSSVLLCACSHDISIGYESIHDSVDIHVRGKRFAVDTDVLDLGRGL